MITEIAGKFQASNSAGEVSSLLILPKDAIAILLLAHGAGAPMQQAHMKNIADSLAEQRIGTFRYNFPYMENSKKRIDPRPIIFKTIEAAYKAVSKACLNLPIFAGGHSFGGRMTSTVVSNGGLQKIKGLIFYSFPLHPSGKQTIERAEQ